MAEQKYVDSKVIPQVSPMPTPPGRRWFSASMLGFVFGFLLIVPWAIVGMLVGAAGGMLASFVGLDVLVYPLFFLGLVGGIVAWPFAARAMAKRLAAWDARGDDLSK